MSEVRHSLIGPAVLSTPVSSAIVEKRQKEKSLASGEALKSDSATHVYGQACTWAVDDGG
jgi:hypothetical protein